MLLPRNVAWVMRYVWLSKLWAIVCTVPFPVSFHSSGGLRFSLLHGTFSLHWPEDGLLCPFPFLFTNFCNIFFFSFQSLWIKKNKGQENREAPLRDTGDIAECNFGKGLSAKVMDVTREPESNSLAHCKRGQKLQQKPYMLGPRGCLISGVFFFCFFFLVYGCITPALCYWGARTSTPLL